MDNLTLFIALTTAAVVIQAGILVALYLSVRKSSARLETLAAEVKTKVLPTAEVAHSMLVELRPKIETIVDNISEASTIVRAQMERLDATVNDVIDRTRLQVIRADELLNRTIDRVEETTEMVHKTVVSPIRQLTGLLQGVSAGLEFLIGRKRRQRQGAGMPQDEMFI
jgi:methyl-accepting chemotaxis protein